MKVKYYNLDKLERAKRRAGVKATEKDVLEAYKVEGGRYDILEEEKPVPKRGKK